MKLDPIVLAVPFYFVGIGVELWLASRLKRGLYRLDDTFNNLACGLFQQLLVLLLAVPLAAPYLWLYEHARVTDWFAGHTAVAWAVAFVGSDFFYYWFHRWSHESAAGWFSHVVHHQSEFYNLSVALRQDAWQPLFSLWFQLPLALLGVPPLVFATAYGLVIVYQFWIHTRLIDRMGPLEWVMNTPSHHRVHHGVDPQYLDKNYAGVFIVWDRLFGTFEPERVAPTYGTIEPLSSFNPVWSHLAYGKKLWLKARSMPDAWSALQALVRSPGWQPPGREVEDFDALAAERLAMPTYAITVAPGARRYSVAGFVTSMALGVIPLQVPSLPLAASAALAALSAWGLGDAAGIAEARAWAVTSERARLALCVAATVGLAFETRQLLWLAPNLVTLALAALLPDAATRPPAR